MFYHFAATGLLFKGESMAVMHLKVFVTGKSRMRYEAVERPLLPWQQTGEGKSCILSVREV